MFGELLQRSTDRIESVRSVLKVNDQVRTLLFSPQAGELTELQARVATYFGSTPDSTLWRVYDHCAAITRLYAISLLSKTGSCSLKLGGVPSYN